MQLPLRTGVAGPRKEADVWTELQCQPGPHAAGHRGQPGARHVHELRERVEPGRGGRGEGLQVRHDGAQVRAAADPRDARLQPRAAAGLLRAETGHQNRLPLRVCDGSPLLGRGGGGGGAI